MSCSKINFKGLITYSVNIGYYYGFEIIKNNSTTKDKAEIYTICV